MSGVGGMGVGMSGTAGVSGVGVGVGVGGLSEPFEEGAVMEALMRAYEKVTPLGLSRYITPLGLSRYITPSLAFSRYIIPNNNPYV